MDDQTTPKLEIRGVGKTFVGHGTTPSVEALKDVNLMVRPSEFVGLVGASGCGKTTLLRIANGLIAPTTGGVLLDGRPISGPGQDRGFVFQNDALLPWRTVLDNVALGLEAQRKGRDEARRIAQEYITVVEMQGFEQYHPAEISGGMRQRVNLARALAIDPEVLLMDEPFASLDAQTREIMQGELLSIWSRQKKTVMFVTHQIDEAVYLSDRVVVMTARPGRVKEILPVDIPRPRPLAVKRTPEFVQVVDRVWKLIEEEVAQSLRVQARSGARLERSPSH
jgi:NitT/TauT family transport system ATP-binding protein